MYTERLDCAHAAADCLSNRFLAGRLLVSALKHFLFDLAGNYQHAVQVTEDEIARKDAYATISMGTR